MNESLFKRNKKYLLTFSAGPDSVYGLIKLIHFFKNEFSYTNEDIKKYLHLCYINYHDSIYVDKEESIVFYYKNKYDLNVYKIDNYDIFNNSTNNKKASKLSNKSINFEDAARIFRYKEFSRIFRENNFEAIVINEHLTDVLETFYLQNNRHSIVSYYGLKDKNYIYDSLIIRPFLDTTKKDIISFLNKRNYIFYDDITNYNLDKKRNLYRNYLHSLSKVDFERLKKENLNKIKEFNFTISRIDSLIKKEIVLDSTNISFSFKKLYTNKNSFSKNVVIKKTLYYILKNKFNCIEEKDLLKKVNLSYYLLKKQNKSMIYFVDTIQISLETQQQHDKLFLLKNNDSFLFLTLSELTKHFTFKTTLTNRLEDVNIKNYFKRNNLFEKLQALLISNNLVVTNLLSLNKFNENISFVDLNNKLKAKDFLSFIKEFKIRQDIKNIVPFIYDINKNRIVYVFNKLNNTESLEVLRLLNFNVDKFIELKFTEN